MPDFSVFHSYLSHECGQQSESPWDTRAAALIYPNLKEWAAAANFECRSYNILNMSIDFKKLMEKKDSGVTKRQTTTVWVYNIQWAKLEACLRLHGLFNSNA